MLPNLILSPMLADLIFHHEHKDTRINYQISHTALKWSAILKHSGDLYEWSGVQWWPSQPGDGCE